MADGVPTSPGNGRRASPVLAGSGASPLRYLLALALAPAVAALGFALLGEWFRWPPIGHGLLPFDAAASTTDVTWVSLALAATLCTLRALGVTWWGSYVGVSVWIAIAATAARGAAPTLPFWLAAAAVGGATGGGVWTLLRAPRRRRPFWARGLAGVGVAALLFVLVLPSLLWYPASAVQHLQRAVVPTADGGTVSRYSWYIPGFLDSSHANRVLYTPPGWWSRAELVTDLLPDDELNGVQYFADGERRAVILETTRLITAGPAPAAKRVMFNVNWMRWANEPQRPPRLVPRWEPPRLDFPCLWRGFEPPSSRRGEALVRRGTGVEAVEAGATHVDHSRGIACARPGTWRPSTIDLQQDRLLEEAADPGTQPRTLVYSSRAYDDPWVVDLERTLAANPTAQPLPLPPLQVVVTVVQVPGRFDGLPEDRRIESLLAVDGARVACQVEAPLRQFEPVELVCDPPPHAAPRRIVVTGLWGDPNPDVAAIAVTDKSGRRYRLQPIDWELGVDTFHGAMPVETTFIRLRRSVEPPGRLGTTSPDPRSPDPS